MQDSPSTRHYATWSFQRYQRLFFCACLLPRVTTSFSVTSWPTSRLCRTVDSRFPNTSISKHPTRLCQLRILATSSREEEQEEALDPRFIRRNQFWVVLVDDEESIRMPVGDYLYDEGYQITACADAAALLEDVLPKGVGSSDRLPDAIVSDIRMPVMDGLELLAKIRENPQWSRIPVILLTAKGLTVDRVAGYQAGADAYLTKPFDPEELLSLLDNLILRRQQLQEKSTAGLSDLQQDLASIRQIMQENTKQVVQSTPVFLSDTERSVLQGVCEGQTNAEIAKAAGLSADKVSRTLSKLYQVTDCQTRTELVRWAFSTGYASPYT